jgi:MATE family multidrug resistance protein
VSEPISSPIRAPGDNAEEVRTLWRLGWPVALGGVGMLGMGAVDTAMVGPLGEQALAALSASNMWVHGLAVFGRGIMMGVDPIVSQAHGRGDSQRIAGAARAVLLLAVLIAIPLWGGYQLAASGLQALGQPAEILPDVALYCRAVALGVPGFMVFWAVRQLMQGVEVMRPATIAIIVANVLNVFLNACFVHGWLGAPALGVVGAGYATAGSSWCMAFMLVWLCRADLLRLLKQPSQHGIVHHARDIVLMGSPVAVQLGIEIWGFVAAGVMIGWMGTTALAGHAIALLVASISFMVPLGIGSGATTRVGNLLGAGFPWQRSGWLAIALGGSISTVAAVVFVTLPGPIARLFTPDAAVVGVVVILLPIAATFQVVDGLQVTAQGVLRGIGDVRMPMVFNVLAHWCVGMPTAAVLAFWLDWGVAGVWWGLVAGLSTVGVLVLLRLLQLGARPLRSSA